MMNIPWSPTKLSEVLEPISRAEPVNPVKEYRLLGIRLGGGGAFHRETKRGSQISAKTLSQVRTGDFIYSRLFAWRGAFGVIGSELDGCYVSGEFPTFMPIAGKLDVQFLRLWFCLPTIISRVEANCTGSTPLTRNRFKEHFFLAMEIPLPPLTEQRRIVTRIEQLVAKIDEARVLRGTAEVEGRALFGAALNTCVSSLPPVIGTLGEILKEAPRNGWSVRCDGTDGGTPVLTLSAVTGFRYDPKAIKRTSEPVERAGHYWLKPGDILITRSNTPELVGHAAVYDGRPSPCIYPDLMMRCRVRTDKADIRFVHFWLQSSVVREHIRHRAKGTSPTMKKIAQADVQEIPFPILDLDAQRIIVKELMLIQDKVDTLTRLQEQTAKELDALLPAILDKAFKGEL